MLKQTFPGFDHKAKELSAYAFSINIFVIALVNNSIIRFAPVDTDQFRKWLDDHKVRDVSKVTISNYAEKGR